MSDFRKLEEGIFASPQIAVGDIVQARELGVTPSALSHAIAQLEAGMQLRLLHPRIVARLQQVAAIDCRPRRHQQRLKIQHQQRTGARWHRWPG